MALNFPANPSPGQVFTAEGSTFIWSGTVWRTVPPSIPFATGQEAADGVRDDVVMSPLTTRQAIEAAPIGDTAVEDANVVAVSTTAVAIGQTPAFVATRRVGIMMSSVSFSLATTGAIASDLTVYFDLYENGVLVSGSRGATQQTIPASVAGLSAGLIIPINRRLGNFVIGRSYDFRFFAVRAQAGGTVNKVRLRADFIQV